MVITGLENDKVKELVRLQQKKERDLTGTYLVEGDHLVEEAYKNGCLLQVIALEEMEVSFPCDILRVTDAVMKKISALDHPPKMMGLCKKKENVSIVGDKILLLDSIQDPGNLGTMIRSSLAFGVSTIILSPDCVDLYNPKVVRGTQGMMFHIPILSMDTKEAISYMRKHQIPVYGTSVVTGVDPSLLSAEEKKSYCIIMGNEGNGLSDEILSLCDQKITIPMNSMVESLNVGVACSIILYEMRRGA